MPSEPQAGGGGPARERRADRDGAGRRGQERELEGLLAALVGLLGPLLIVGMGLFVMGIVFAMLLPIFEMNSLIR